MYDGNRFHVSMADDLADTDRPPCLRVGQILEGIKPAVLQAGDVALLDDEGVGLQRTAATNRAGRDDDIAVVAAVDRAA